MRNVRPGCDVLNMDTNWKKTEMSTPKSAEFYTEPTHDEIAFCAFLLWEKDGSQPGRETHYWLEAETQLRATRLKKAEAAAALAAKPWPPAKRSTKPAKAPVAAKPAVKPVTKLEAKVATKPAVPMAKLAPAPTRATAVKAAASPKPAPAPARSSRRSA